MANDKNINDWAKELKHNEKVAKKYQGVKNVEDILRVAHEDGYNFSKKELLSFDLGAVAGGGGNKEKNVGGKGVGVGANVDNTQLSNNDIDAKFNGTFNAKFWGDEIENKINNDVKVYNTGSNSKGYIDYKPTYNISN